MVADAPQRHDVILIGAGPTGLTLGNLLGRMGMRVALIERNETTVQEPRAVSIDDESMRTMQAAGLASEVQAITARGYGSDYFGPNGRIFASVKPVSREYGFEKRNAFQQPELEDVLRCGLLRFPNVRPMFGHEAVAHHQDGKEVVLTVRSSVATADVAATYVVACDGGRSWMRKALGIELVGSTFEEPWLIVDLKSTQNRNRHTEVFCDPKRAAISLPGPNGIRRYEFKLRRDEDPDAATEESFVRDLLARVGPDRDAPLSRIRSYTFHARIASRWRDRRIFLAGDAAHLTPPFAGQGMNSGIRDAHNLAWKLAEALATFDEDARDRLLGSYELERKPHALAMIRLAQLMGEVMMPDSTLKGALVRAGFRALGLYPPAKDYFVQMRYKPKPRFEAGLVWRNARDALAAVTGSMLPQPEVEDLQRTRHLLDDLVPDAPVLLVYDRMPDRVMAPELQHRFESHGCHVVGLTPEGVNPVEAGFPIYRDAGGVLTRRPYAGLVGSVFLLRRDRYIAAAAPASRAADLIDPLRAIRQQQAPRAGEGQREAARRGLRTPS
jgi:3-(3-hydroxy-phenyl)propionate hydroxylase